jgi:hypothetical protein
MSIKCWLGFHARVRIARYPDIDPSPCMKYGFWYTYKCEGCGHVWEESPQPFD